MSEWYKTNIVYHISIVYWSYTQHLLVTFCSWRALGAPDSLARNLALRPGWCLEMSARVRRCLYWSYTQHLLVNFCSGRALGDSRQCSLPGTWPLGQGDVRKCLDWVRSCWYWSYRQHLLVTFCSGRARGGSRLSSSPGTWPWDQGDVRKCKDHVQNSCINSHEQLL